MNKIERDKLKQVVQCNQKQYLNTLCDISHKLGNRKKIKNFNNKFLKFLRCEYTSNNSLKQIPHLSALIWGIQDFQRQINVDTYNFCKELSTINQYIIFALDSLLTSKYNSQCASYGEALLNCYLDLYITFTIRATKKEIDTHPNFLVSPLTGTFLEIDVLFENFRLAFEFQGEHHYTDTSTQIKDTIKCNLYISNNHVLIPVNISQLSHTCLSTLICNSIKEQKDLTGYINDFDKTNINKKTVHQLYKVIQRMYLTHTLFKETLDWLDDKAIVYINGRIPSSPISAQSNAPRIKHISNSTDLDIETLYSRIPRLRKMESK